MFLNFYDYTVIDMNDTIIEVKESTYSTKKCEHDFETVKGKNIFFLK